MAVTTLERERGENALLSGNEYKVVIIGKQQEGERERREER